MNKEEAEELYHVAISAGSILAMPCLAKCLFHKKQTKDARQLISAFISKMSEDNSKNDIDDEIIDKILNELD
jgi:hypothetical protein